MLEVGGVPIIRRLADRFSEQGVEEVTVIRGYQGWKIDLPGADFVDNHDYAGTNILHSLIRARRVFEEAGRNGDRVVISYSDIVIEARVLSTLLEERADLALAVDTDWLAGYAGRSDHPPEEAEVVLLEGNRQVKRIAKNLFPGGPPAGNHGEFIGLWQCSAAGARTVLRHVDRLERRLRPDDPFQGAARWREAYLTDLFQEMIDQGEEIKAALIAGGWVEIDTEQDYRRAQARQWPGRG
jgi:choline kinase